MLSYISSFFNIYRANMKRKSFQKSDTFIQMFAFDLDNGQHTNNRFLSKKWNV